MSVSEMFSGFIDNLIIDNRETISNRYEEITCALNKEFRDTDSKTANSLQIGSFGRNTGIHGISDLDMLYIMPKSKWDKYKDSNQYQLLRDTADAILARYPKTDVKPDRLVVTVTYNDFHIEVQPVFEQDDGSFTYPDTKDGGSWKQTKPREEMEAVATLDDAKNANLRRLCKMARAWKNKHGVGMGGLLIDTLAYNFLESTAEYDDKSYSYYDWLSRDFFKHLMELPPDQERYHAPGSRQHVKVKKRFQRKAKRAHELCNEAIAAEKEKGVNEKWKRVYGRPFPAAPDQVKESTVANMSARSWRDTEQFIEDKYPVDIRYDLTIECTVIQDGFRPQSLLEMIRDKVMLKPSKRLHFFVAAITVPGEFDLMWKVLNRGPAAEARNCIRGQIIWDGGNKEIFEHTNFKGDHIVECYAIKNNIVVAKDRIHVPIEITH